MKKVVSVLFVALSLVVGCAYAAGGGIPLDKAPNKVNDLPALQNGAKIFVNYCLSCHSAAYMRFNRLRDIGLTDEDIKNNLLFTTEKVGETMKATINPTEAKEWFGANPPDLTVIARSSASGAGSGADYLYTFLRTFYRDETRPTGWNNLAFPNVGMPHVLWELQGERQPVFEEVESHGHNTSVFKGWKQVKPGTMEPIEFDQAIGDLVNYLQWMGEPAQNTRKRVGVVVLIFLLLLTIITWRLNAAFWKDVK
jgi:ubiquinol-cytochrome c reductase cytochrome c1 subunit